MCFRLSAEPHTINDNIRKTDHNGREEHDPIIYFYPKFNFCFIIFFFYVSLFF